MAQATKCSKCARPFAATFAKCPFCGVLAPGASPATPHRKERAEVLAELADALVTRPSPFALFAITPAVTLAIDALCDAIYTPDGVGVAPGKVSWQPSEGQLQAAMGWGALVGELLRRTWGGRWVADPRRPQVATGTFMQLPDGRQCTPLEHACRRIRDGRAASFVALLDGLRMGLPVPAGELAGWRAQGEFFARAGRGDIAEQAYRRAAQVANGRERVELADLADRARAQAHADEAALAAEVQAREARARDAPVRKRPTLEPEHWVQVGHEHAGRGELEPALAAYDRALAMAPDHAEALRESSVCLAMLERLREAEVRAQRVRALTPDDPRAFDHLAVIMGRAGRFVDAVGVLDDGLVRHPAAGVLLMRRGNFTARLGDLTDAVRFLERAVAAAPDLLEASVILGGCLVRQGDPVAAAAAVQRGLARARQDDPLLATAQRMVGDLAAKARGPS